jgi:glutamine amidotransferase
VEVNVGIVDYEGGNLASVAKAVEHLGYRPLISDRAEVLLDCKHVIFPGVGAAGATMEALKQAKLIELLQTGLEEAQIPCLGICIGIQVLFEHSEEDNVDTLGIFKGQVKRFPIAANLKVPHIGWNQVEFPDMNHHILKDMQSGDHFYFVNSYYVEPEDQSIVLGETVYGNLRFTSMIRGKNWTASQFHLEKSGLSGLKLLKNFLDPPCP